MRLFSTTRLTSMAVVAAVCCFNVFAQDASLQEKADQIRSLNEQLRAGGADRVKLRSAAVDVRTALETRATLLADVIEKDAQLALSLALPQEEIDALRSANPDAGGLIETHGEWRGPAQVLVEDDFENRTSRTITRLGDINPLDISFAQGTPDLTCEHTITVQGIRLGAKVAAASSQVAPDELNASSCSVTGPQNVAVLLVQFPGVPLPGNVNTSFLQNAFFGAGKSLDSFWRENSYGKTSAGGTVFGPFTLDANYQCNQTSQIMQAAIRAADSSVNFQNYTRVFVIMPYNGSCAIGTGQVGCGSWSSAGDGSFRASVSWLPVSASTFNDSLVSVVVHEAGHNLGLGHSGTESFGNVSVGAPGTKGVEDEYADIYAAMGLSYNAGGSMVIGHYAAPHKARLGWLTPQIVTAGGTFTIGPTEVDGSSPKALKVQRGTNAWLWLEYRQGRGLFDTSLNLYSGTAYSGLLVHHESPNNSSTGNRSLLLDMVVTDGYENASISAGRTWSDTFTPLSIRVDAANANGATATVSYGSSCLYTVSPTSQGHGSAAASGSISVSTSTGCNWTASSNSDWITVTSGGSGSGNGSVGYTVAANAGGAARTGSITVAGQTVTITQDAGSCSYSLNSTSVNAASGQSNGGFTVQAGSGCSWTASTSASWLTITSGTSGSGTGNVNYFVQANVTGAPRTGTITAAGQTFTVVQAGAACQFSLNPSSSAYTNAGGIGSVWVNVGSGCSWTATTTAPWITMTSASGNGTGVMAFTVAPNTSGAARSATINVGSLVFNVTQQAAVCTYSISAPGAQFSSTAAAGAFTVNAGSGCTWLATSSATWITVTTGSSGSGSGAVGFTVAANDSPVARTGTINVAGHTYTITQNGGAPVVTCTYSVSGTSSFGATGGTGSLTVTTPPGCTWSVNLAGTWVQLTSAGSGANSSVVTFSVGANTTNAARTAVVTIGDQTFTITQGAPSGQSGGAAHFFASFREGFVAIDRNGNTTWDGASTDRAGSFGQQGDIAFAGDWDGSGVVRLGLFRNGVWFFDWNNNLQWDGDGVDRIGFFGQPGDVPFIGDWDGSGRTRIGVFRNGGVFLDVNGNLGWDAGDRSGHFGMAGDIPVIGRWNGGTTDVLAVYRAGSIFVDRNGNLAWDSGVDGAGSFGQQGDVPVVGDWDGTGVQKLGVFRNGWFFLDRNGNLNWDAADAGGSFGFAGDTPVVGDWDGTNRSRVGVFRNGSVYLDIDGNLAWDGGADRSGIFGQAGGAPVIAKW